MNSEINSPTIPTMIRMVPTVASETPETCAVTANLTSLTIQHGKTGGSGGGIANNGTLTITLEPRNGGVQIRFQDTGVGLTENELKRLFVPFNSTFRNGTGLGLSIVYQIVSAHNGTIGATSKKGVGTTFVIDLI